MRMNIKLRFSKSPSIDDIILCLFLLQVLIICWISLDLQDFINHILVVLMVVSLCKKNRFLHSKSAMFFWLFILYQFFNFLFLGGKITFFLRNWYRTFKSILIIMYVVDLTGRNGTKIADFLDHNFKLFNVYAVVNIPVLLIQRTHDFRFTSLDALIGSISYRNSMFYSKDMMSGLFGLFGTPRLAMFVAFLISYNYVRNNLILKKSSKLFDLYNFSLLAFYLWMATQNDNKGFFLIVPFFVTVLFFSINESKILQKYKHDRLQLRIRTIGIILKSVSAVIILCFALFVFYKTIPLFQETVDEALQKVNEGILVSSYTSYTKVTGGGERIAMILFALSRFDTALFGYGLGNYIYTSGNLGFAHFGQADVGTFICLGGSIYIILMFVLLYSNFRLTYKKSFIPLIMLIVFFILSCYTHVLMDTSITISLLLFYCTVWIPYNKNFQINKTNC